MSRKNLDEKWLFCYPDQRNEIIAQLTEANTQLKEEVRLLKEEINTLVGTPLFKKWAAQEKSKKKK